MTLDYQKVHQQVQQLGAEANGQLQQRRELLLKSMDLLKSHAGQPEQLEQKVLSVVRNHDPNLRCARPARGPQGEFEPLDGKYPLPSRPAQASILAADGSQISPNRHAAVNFGLINIGAIQASLSSAEAPQVLVHSELIFGERLYSAEGALNEAQLALMRDLRERKQLEQLAEHAGPPVITFTDGPMELWGGREAETGRDYQKSLQEYLEVLRRLETLEVVTAGYVDKPASSLVVRLLEIASLPDDRLPEVRESFTLRAVLDRELFRDLLAPGERSAVFAIQSATAHSYPGSAALHFFYLNVGRPGHPWLARVEIPAWVVRSPDMLDQLHAILVQQCRILGNRRYPYLLHRAHEAALVTWQDRQQVSSMIELELRQRGLEVGEASHKQALKDLRTNP